MLLKRKDAYLWETIGTFDTEDSFCIDKTCRQTVDLGGCGREPNDVVIPLVV